MRGFAMSQRSLAFRLIASRVLLAAAAAILAGLSPSAGAAQQPSKSLGKIPVSPPAKKNVQRADSARKTVTQVQSALPQVDVTSVAPATSGATTGSAAPAGVQRRKTVASPASRKAPQLKSSAKPAKGTTASTPPE